MTLPAIDPDIGKANFLRPAALVPHITQQKGELTMAGIIMWLMGVPLTVIILLYLFVF